ncbi:MAG: segregation/condensation protein A [bacterium]
MDTEVYEGPLDLLLDLIQKAELDITSLSLAKVTDQYLAYIDTLQNISAEEISEFLVIAAKLVQIKSEALLPRPPIRDKGEEDPGEILSRQLRVYREIKNTTLWLKERFDRDLRTYLHVPHQYTPNMKLDLSNFNLDDLTRALREIYAHEADIASLGTVISIPKISLRKQVQNILQVLSKNNATSFRLMLEQDSSRINAIIIFLALLELVKQDYVITHQNQPFADIEIEATEKVNLSEEFEFTSDD